MKKCSVVITRKNLESAHILAKAGIEFIPIPVFGEISREYLERLLEQQLYAIENEINNEE